MRLYLRFCKALDLPPKLYLLSLVAGFVGMLTGTFFDWGRQFHQNNQVFMLVPGALAFAPFALVFTSVKGGYWERSVKAWCGNMIAFFVLIAGSAIGLLLARHYHQ